MSDVSPELVPPPVHGPVRRAHNEDDMDMDVEVEAATALAAATQTAEDVSAKTELERRMERQQTSFAVSSAEIRERLLHLRGDSGSSGDSGSGSGSTGVRGGAADPSPTYGSSVNAVNSILAPHVSLGACMW